MSWPSNICRETDGATAAMANFEDPLPLPLPSSLSTLELMFHAQFYTRDRCNHFMCTTGQLLIYDSPEGEAELPTCDLCLVAFLCLLSRVETTFAYRILACRAIPRFISIVALDDEF